MPDVIRPELGQELMFASSVAGIADPVGNGYLGSIGTIDAMLRSAAMDWIELLVDGTADLKQAKRIAQGVARTLLGMEPGFGLVPGWNAAGGIDEFLVRERGVKDRQPLARVEAVVVQFIRQITDIVNYANEQDTTDEQWRWQMDAAFEEFALLFTGVPADAAELLAPPSSEASAETLQEGWVTINTGDDDEGGQRIYIDGSGVIKTGHFAGKSLKQAFGRKADSAKSDPEDKTPPPKDEPAKPTKPAAPDPADEKGDAVPKPATGVGLQSWDQAGWKKAQADASATAKSTIGDWSTAADADQKAAVNWYQDGGYRAVNTQLRTGKAVDPNLAQQKKDWGRAFTNEELMSQMDGLMAKTKATKDFAAYRGVGADEAKALLAMKPGESFTRPDYVSTSLNPNLAYSSFASPSVGGGNVLMKINGKAGTPAMYLGDTENEALLGRGNSFVLKSTSKATGPNGQQFDVLEFDIADAKKPATPAKAAGAPSPVPPTPAAKPKVSQDANWSDAHKSVASSYDSWNATKGDEFDTYEGSDKSENAALHAFVSSEFTQMNGDPKHPANAQFKKMLAKLPDYQPPSGKIHRVLGFETAEDAAAYVKTLSKPQVKSFSSWTVDDPTKPGASPMNHIGLDLASQFGDHTVILSYENPKGAKDISFAYHAGAEKAAMTGTEQILQAGHKFEVLGVEKKGDKTYVRLGNPGTKPAAKAEAPAKKSAAPKTKQFKTEFEDASVEKSFAKQFPKTSPGQLVGAPDGAKVRVVGKVGIIAPGESSDDLYEGTQIIVEHPSIKTMKRVVYRDHEDVLTIRNESLETIGPGVGRQILKDQIREARAAGVRQITANAAKVGAGGKKFNGYYTWARYGYDADLTSMPGGGKAVRAAFPKAKKLSDVMATEEGRKWWKANGSSFDGTFDLTPGSRSMQVFNGYLEAKGEGSI